MARQIVDYNFGNHHEFPLKHEEPIRTFIYFLLCFQCISLDLRKSEVRDFHVDFPLLLEISSFIAFEGHDQSLAQISKVYKRLLDLDLLRIRNLIHCSRYKESELKVFLQDL